jgi:hypothetical protein
MLYIRQLSDFLNQFYQDSDYWQRWRVNRHPVIQQINRILTQSKSDISATNLAVSESDRKNLYEAIANAVAVDTIRARNNHFYQLLFDILNVENKIDDIEIWQILRQAKILTQENYRAIKRQQQRPSVISAIKMLAKWQLLGQSELRYVLDHPNKHDLADGLKHLRAVRKSYNSPYHYFPINRDRISEHFMNSVFFSIFFPILSFLVLAVTMSVFPLLLVTIPFAMIGCWYISKKIRQWYLRVKHPIAASAKAMLQSKHPTELLEAYDQLSIFDRDQVTSNLLQASEYPISLRFLLTSIKKSSISKLYKDKFIESIQSDINLNYLKQYFLKLLDLLIVDRSYFLLDEQELKFALEHIRVITHPDINAIIMDDLVMENRQQLKRILLEVCTQDMSDQQKIDTITRRTKVLLNQRPILINKPQSTHTASVHQSVSESATRFQRAYEDQVKSDQAIASIKKSIMTFLLNRLHSITEINQQSKLSDLKIRAAIDTVERLFNSAYREPIHQVAIRDMLFYFWIGMHDDAYCRVNSQTDREEIFINILYEIRRGYNIDLHGNDDGRSSKKICPAGAFNKLLEGLQLMQHDLAEVILINRETASLKLRALTECELVKVVHKKIVELPIEASTILLDKLFSDYQISDEIWDELEPSIISAFTEEYQTLFVSSESLKVFVGGGKYVELDEAKYRPLFEAVIAKKSGTPTVLKSLGQQGLFANDLPPKRHQVNAILQDPQTTPNLSGSYP